jgi:hypothetical protein
MSDLPVSVQQAMEGLRSEDHGLQDAAFQFLMATTRQPVEWAYLVWDDLLALLKAGDNRQRAIAAQVLCSLAKGDSKHRIRKDLALLIHTTRDERFVTARHTMQSLWKVGVLGAAERMLLIDGLSTRFTECISEKNCTLIRYDILACLRRVYDETKDEALRTHAAQLIELEDDPKYRKKYATLWRK